MDGLGLEPYGKKKGWKIVLVLVYLILGLYFINYPFSFVTIPESVSQFDSWIIFAGGIFLVFGAINYFRLSRR
jgi:predicted membrane channel-forming protein YqfA (hemolysin III family)